MSYLLKRILAFFIPFIMLISIMPSSTVSAENFISGLVYRIKNDVEERELVIPEEIDSIPVTEVRFYDNTTVEKLYIPKTVTDIYIKGKTDEKFALKEINVSEDNPNYTSVDGVLYSKDMKILYYYPCAKTDKSFIVPDSVETIGLNSSDSDFWAFANCQNLKSIAFNDGLKLIGVCSFYNTLLEKIVIPEGVEVIGNSAFSYNNNLKEIVVPKGVKDAELLVYNCFNLETVTFLEDDVKMPDYLAADFNKLNWSFYNDFFTDVNSESKITVYVPDSKFDVYKAISETWENIYFELLPISKKENIDSNNLFKICDINGDGVIGIADAVIFQKAFITCSAIFNMDINSDGKFNVFDLIILKRKILYS